MSSKECILGNCKKKAKLIQENNMVKEYKCKCGAHWIEKKNIKSKK